jgi:uncharacterized protein
MTFPILDTHEFTRRGDSIDGDEPVSGLSRLVTLLADPSGAIAWRLAGRSVLGADGSRTPYLDLDFSGTVRMHCVRCLEPVTVTLEERRGYRLVATEEQAEREDPDEDELDLLVSSRRFDLGALIEDEAIMALPAAPAHDDCQAPERATGSVRPVVASPTRPNPFAALGALRGAAAGPGAASAEPEPVGGDDAGTQSLAPDGTDAAGGGASQGGTDASGKGGRPRGAS